MRFRPDDFDFTPTGSKEHSPVSAIVLSFVIGAIFISYLIVATN